MFGPQELQRLISGSASPINISDLRAHTHYAGGYDDRDPYIEMFWRVLGGLEEDDKRKSVWLTQIRLTRCQIHASAPSLQIFELCDVVLPPSLTRIRYTAACVWNRTGAHSRRS